MDANGHRFWMLSEPGDFDLADGSCQFTGDCLHLSGTVVLPDQAAIRSQALPASDLPAVAVGRFDDWAVYDPSRPHGTHPGCILGATGKGELSPLIGIPAGAEIRDMWVDDEGVLRIAGKLPGSADGLIFIDLRGRWAEPVLIETQGAVPDRGAGRWVLERARGRLWRETGAPLADLALRTYADHIFRPDPEYANPVRLEELPRIAKTPAERIVDCAVMVDGSLAVLIHSSPQAKRSFVELIPRRGERVRVEVPLTGFATSLGAVSDRQIALTYVGSKRAVVIDVGDGERPTLSLEPNRTPLVAPGTARICRGTVLPAQVVHFADGAVLPLAPPRPLQALSMPSYRSEGVALASQAVRAPDAATVWHRVVVEGDLPPGTGVALSLQVADREDELAGATPHNHYAGDIPVALGAPQLTWLDAPSELPLHPRMLSQPPLKHRTGCFSGLVQSGDKISRELAGRFVKISLRLFGTGQASPMIAAVRLYGSRFSLVRNYLPTVMQPPLDPALRTTTGAAHSLDFLDRYVAGFERVLTGMEDRVVAAPALTDPLAAPAQALDWLAGWIGLTMRSGLNDRQRRVMLANGMRLHRRRGTLPGLRLALDIASEGQVGAGGIVALEDFRLRRVFATILGADLGSRFDPLLAGPVESGNSFVGSTLHLADAEELNEGKPVLSATQLAEIAALYRPPSDPDQLDAVRSFFAELAWKVTVLVHHDADEARLSLIRDVAAQMTPAHVRLRVERASRPLILGLYSLLGVDSYLRPRPGASPVISDVSDLGVQDQILSLPSLDPATDYGGLPS